jgi:hypothetical protein
MKNIIPKSFKLELQDVHKLNQSLGNSVGEYRIPMESFNHLDFVWAIHVKSLVYDEVISFMANY